MIKEKLRLFLLRNIFGAMPKKIGKEYGKWIHGMH